MKIYIYLWCVISDWLYFTQLIIISRVVNEREWNILNSFLSMMKQFCIQTNHVNMSRNQPFRIFENDVTEYVITCFKFDCFFLPSLFPSSKFLAFQLNIIIIINQRRRRRNFECFEQDMITVISNLFDVVLILIRVRVLRLNPLSLFPHADSIHPLN